MKRETAMMPGYGAKPAPPVVQVDPKTLTDVVCPECGGNIFDKKFGLKELGALHPQNVTRRAQRMEYVIYVCRNCGRALDLK
ncbi:MAG: hypothetical protein M0P44_06600 [Clostridiales bacterium]|nr:hypothetical protein [Clostridiales bacterium]